MRLARALLKRWDVGVRTISTVALLLAVALHDCAGRTVVPVADTRLPPQQLADAMHGAWVRFARDGDPGWPRYDVQHRATMRFGLTPSVVEDPYARERQLWAGLR